jgi:hypothetical protein
MTKLASVGQPEWITPTLLNGWVYYGAPYNTPGYYKDQFGRVWIKGLIKSGTTTNGTAVFQLPVDYRPPSQYLLTSATNDATFASKHCRIDVDTSGNVLIYDVSSVWVSLDRINFSTKA